MSEATYLLHGVRVRSELPLDAPCASCADAGGPGDSGAMHITVALGRPRPVPDLGPVPEELAAVREGGRTFLSLRSFGGGDESLNEGDESFGEGSEGFALCYPGLLEAFIDPSLTRLELHLDPGGDERLAPLVVAAGAMACVLTLAGHLVLHASAVEVGGRAVAFVGGSGTGKSTLAAAACAGGARHLTDDALRLEAGSGRAWCYPGTRSIRLRPDAACLARRLAVEPAGTWPSADGRTCVTPRVSPYARPELDAVVVACPHRGLSQPRRLHAAEATAALLSNPRLAGLAGGPLARSHLVACAKLSRAVAVFELGLPLPGDPVAAAAAVLDKVALAG